MTPGEMLPQLRQLPGQPTLPLGAFELRDQGYVAEEYVLSGEATAYALQGSAGKDGRWNARPATVQPFVTRIVVVRPADTARFSSDVVVEWLNVSAGGDSPPGWVTMHREIIRAGHAYVGVTTQKVAVDGGASLGLAARPLKAIDARRYGELRHPGDTYALDLFAQVGLALRRDAQRLFGAPARHTVAFGASQSAFFLTTFINAVAPLRGPFDGYLVQARFAGVAPVAEADIFNAAPHPDVQFRTDFTEPVLVVESETDVMDVGIAQGGYATARQPDDPRLTVWEIAGSAHADLSIFAVGEVDTDGLSPRTRASAWRPRVNLLGQQLQVPFNAAPQQYYMMNAALRRLFEWVDGGRKPASAQPLAARIAAGRQIELERDAQGLALGGVRSPWVDAPLMAHSGTPNPASLMGKLIGQSSPLNRATIGRLYPGGKADYIAKFARALDQAIATGVILPEHRAEILFLGEESWAWTMENSR